MDNIFYPLLLFDYQKKANIHQWRTDIRRLTQAHDSSLFINTLADEQFQEWYRRKLSADLNMTIDSVRTAIEPYTYKNNRLEKKISTSAHP